MTERNSIGSNRPAVLHFIESGIPGGAEKLLIDLCCVQRSLGRLQPIVAHFEHPWFAARCADAGIECFTLPERRLFKSASRLPFFATQLARAMRRRRVSLLHSHLFGPIVGGSLAARLAGIPHVGTLHDIHMLAEQPRRAWQLRACLLLNTCLVTVSQQMRDFYTSRLKWRSESIVYIPNGYDPPADGLSVTRQGLAIPDGHLVAITVGRLMPLKRTGDALRALRAASGARPITLLIVGEGPDGPALVALAEQLGITAKVRFLGARQDVQALLGCSDIFIQCSDTEGLSMSIIEALHSGLACIVTRVGGNPELVHDGYNGITYDVGDIAALAKGIVDLADNEPLRTLMGTRSKELARREYSMQVCVERYLQLYSRLGLDLA